MNSHFYQGIGNRFFLYVRIRHDVHQELSVKNCTRNCIVRFRSIWTWPGTGRRRWTFWIFTPRDTGSAYFRISELVIPDRIGRFHGVCNLLGSFVNCGFRRFSEPVPSRSTLLNCLYSKTSQIVVSFVHLFQRYYVFSYRRLLGLILTMNYCFASFSNSYSRGYLCSITFGHLEPFPNFPIRKNAVLQAVETFSDTPIIYRKRFSVFFIRRSSGYRLSGHEKGTVDKLDWRGCKFSKFEMLLTLLL